MATIEFIKILIFVLLAIDYAAIMCMTMYSAMNFFVFPYPTFFIPLTYLVYWFVIVRVTYSWSTSTLVLRQMVSRPFGVISTNGLLAVMITATIHLIYFNYSLGYFIATFNFNEYPSKSHPLSSRSSIQWWLGMSCTFLIIHDLCTLSLLMVSYKYWVNLVAFLNQDQPRNNGESKESNNFQQQPILYYPPQQVDHFVDHIECRKLADNPIMLKFICRSTADPLRIDIMISYNSMAIHTLCMRSLSLKSSNM